jgi:hypothetical protein
MKDNSFKKGGMKMKKMIICGLLFFLTFCLLGAQSKQTNPFEGNWELVSVEGTYNIEGEIVNGSMVKDANNYGMKMIHDNYFMFVNHRMIKGEASSGYGYGTYTFKNNIYTENIIYHVGNDLIGTSPSYEMTVKGNTLVQKGPLKIGTYKDAKSEFTETYIRK